MPYSFLRSSCIHSAPSLCPPPRGHFLFFTSPPQKHLVSPPMSLHHYHEGRRISSRTPLYDHAGAELGKYPAREIIRLIHSGRVLIIGSKHRIKGLRFVGPDPSHLALSGSKHRRPIGSPHTHENYYNPPGCWHLDRIPSSLRALFGPNVLFAPVAPATIFISMVMV